MKKLLIATHNPAKFSEIKYFLKDLPFKIVSLKNLNIKEDVKEDGKTFKENAVKKAKYYAQKSKLLTIADDGGLEIDYLNGAPGVKSRRWISGKRATDKQLIKHTLKLLKDVPLKKRKAQLRTVVALYTPSSKIYTKEGIIRGIISNKVYSKKYWEGFPFRSIFYLPKISKYYNPDELTKQEELKYNHRGKAITKLKKVLMFL